MMNVNEKLYSVVEYVRDASNPFIRVVNKAMNCSGKSIPFYQVEEVREASFQSDYACEMIIKALSSRLDEGDAVLVNKALCLLRVLFLEGAVGIRSRAGQLRGRLMCLSNQHGVRRETLEESNKDLAGVLLAAIDGNSSALATFSSSYVSGVKDAPATVFTSCKSDFQIMQEKEQRMYRRRCGEERRQNAVIVQNKQNEFFLGSITPEQLVEQVLTNPKKKFARQELDSFVDAAAATGRVPDVCAELERHLAGQQSLQNRYKLLLVTEALVDGAAEALRCFQVSHAGVQRHLSVSNAENPVKAEAARGAAQRIMQRLHAAGNAPAPPQQQQQLQLQPQQPQLWESAKPTEPAPMHFDDFFAGITLSSKPESTPQPSRTFDADIFGTAAHTNTTCPSGNRPRQPQQSIGGPRRTECNIIPLYPVPPPPESRPSLQDQVESAQQNMQAIMSMMVGQQQQQQQREGTWVSSGSAPALDSIGRSSDPPNCTLHNSSGPGPGPAPFDVFAPEGHDVHNKNKSMPIDNDKLRLMEQLQAQMEATRQMLEQQQAAFMALQAEMQKK